jgi:hypothetical protein
MMQHDGERDQARRGEAPAHVFATQREVKTHRREQHADQDRGGDKLERPSDATRNVDSPHAEIVHAGHAAADDGAADRRRRAPAAIDRDRRAGRGDARRRHQ